VVRRPSVPRTILAGPMNQGWYGHHGGPTEMSNPCKDVSIASFQPS
jgi:hypothetical protein